MNKEIQGLDQDLYTYDEVIDLIKEHINKKLYDNDLFPGRDVEIIEIQLHGSRLRDQAKKRSDLDAVVEYKGDIKEDDLFGILNSRPALRIDGIKVDINPIKEDMKSYMKRSDDYDRHKLGLESRIRRLEHILYESLLNEGKKDQEILNSFLGDDYYNKYNLIKNKISDPEYKDIYKLIKKDPNEVKDYIDNFQSSRNRKLVDKSSGAEKLYEDDDWVVYRITTYKAAQLYGKNTRWCITGRYEGHEERGEEYFYDYINDYDLDGGYYFYINKHDPKLKFCVLQETDKVIHSIWDAEDNDLGSSYAKLYIMHNIALPAIKEIPESSDLNVDADIEAIKMQSAIDKASIDDVKNLLDDGCDPDIILDDNATALAYACAMSANLNIIKLLLVNGADPDNGGDNKTPPLCLTAQFNDDEAMELLLKYGANPNIKDQRGKSPIDYANNYIMGPDFTDKCRQLLLKYGAK